MGLFTLIICLAVPSMIGGFIVDLVKHKRNADLEKLKLQKEMLALEVEKEQAQLLRLEAENRQYDRSLETNELRQFDARLKAAQLQDAEDKKYDKLPNKLA